MPISGVVPIIRISSSSTGDLLKCSFIFLEQNDALLNESLLLLLLLLLLMLEILKHDCFDTL